MRRLLVLALCALLTVGCARSDDKAAREAASQPTTTQPPPETRTTPSETDSTPPHSYREVMARLPPFDEPASPEVAAWRRATITAFFNRCSSRKGGAAKASFVAANRAVLNDAAPFPGAAFVREKSVAQYGGNGCRGGAGPATSYTTYRTYRLPAGTKPVAVLGHFEYALAGWLPFRVSGCEWRFTQGPGYVDVRACNRTLVLAAQGRAPVEGAAVAPTLPPRPFGAQYPIVSNHPVTPTATAYEVKPGETCERISGTDVPSIIIPPPPGVSAKISGGQLVVDWTLGTVHGDCPPSALALSRSAAPRATIVEPVHAASGVSRIQLPDNGPRPRQVIARALSVDGAQSRAVAVLVGR